MSDQTFDKAAAINRALSQLQGSPSVGPTQQQMSGFMGGGTDPAVEDAASFFSRKQQVDTSWGSRFKKSFARGSSFSENTGDIIISKTADMADRDTYLGTVVDYLSGELRWKDSVTGEFHLPKIIPASELYGEDFISPDTTDEQRRQAIQDRKATLVDNYYSDVLETGAGAKMAGFFAKALLDPTTAVPVGHSYKASAALGGAVAFSDTATYQLAKDGKLGPTDLMIVTAIGTALGPAGNYVSRKFTQNILGKIDEGIPISGEHVRKQLDDLDMPPAVASSIDADEVASTLNKEFGLSKEGFLHKSIQAANDIKRGVNPTEPLDIIRYQERMAAAVDDFTPSPEQARKAIEIEQMWKEREGTVLFPSDKRISEDFARIKNKLWKQNPTLAAKRAAKEQSTMESAFDKLFKEHNTTVDEFKNTLPKAQRGGVSPFVMRELAGISVGATVGYGLGGEEGALYGAIAGGLLPWGTSKIGRKLYRPVGKMSKASDKLSQKEALKLSEDFAAGAWTFRRPGEVAKQYGTTGRAFAETLRRTDENIRMLTANRVLEIDSIMYHAGIKKNKKLKALVPQVLNKTVREQDVPKEVAKAARNIRAVLERAVRDAKKAGVLTAEQADEMIHLGRTKGYWPRVYDEDYLNTAAGREDWINTLSSYNWEQDQLEKTLRHIIGPSDPIEPYLKMTRKSGKKVIMSRELAKKLFRTRQRVMASSKSSHLERARKIHLPEEVLGKFLLEDPDAVLTSYFRDVYRRVEFAKSFGPNGETMHKFAEDIAKQFPGSKVDDIMWQMYHTASGDINSTIVSQYVNMPQTIKSLTGSISSFENLKLIFAQVLNMTQATANGTMFLLKNTDSFSRTSKIYVKALRNTFSKEGYDFALRSGAAVEATIMEIAGELNATGHTIFGRKLPGILDIPNNSTKFLKATGFLKVEEFQRVLAANMGKAYLEDLLERKGRILAQQATRGISKKQQKSLKYIDDSLAEMGIFGAEKVDEVPFGEMLRASQRFSNTVNFVNAADTLPLAAQSPYARLFRQFKTFIYHQTNHLTDNAIKPAAKWFKSGGREGTIKPLIGYLGVAAPVLGMPIDELRRRLVGDDRELTMTERYLRGVVSIGGLGLWWELAQNAAYDEVGLVSWVAGPGLGDISTVAHGTASTIAESLEKGEIRGEALGRSAMSTLVFPNKRQVMKEMFSDKSSGVYSNLYNDNYNFEIEYGN